MAPSNKPPVVAIVGPTASGKTGLAIQLAQEFAGEVVSADSRQVYRGLDIGTAKVTKAEMDGVPHHLIDVATLPNIYTAHDFVRDAAQTITNITKRDHLPIIAGGTFFYLDLLFRKTTAAPAPPNPKLRDKLQTKSAAQLFTELKQIDPGRAATIDRHNPRRLIRALEIAAAQGKNPPLTAEENPYQTLTLGINRDRNELRERFAARAQDWLESGIVAETQALLASGISRARLQELGFEYTLVLQLIDGELSTAEWRERFVQKNWQYAKRQLTWLRRDPDIHWIDPQERETAVEKVRTFLTPE